VRRPLRAYTALRAAVVGGFPAGGPRCKATPALVHMVVTCETWRYQNSRSRGGRTSVSPCPGLSPYARCHLACVVLTPSIGNAILPLLFPKEHRSRFAPIPLLP
jgi:hypothetical protein